MIDTGFSDGNIQDVDGFWKLQDKRINAYRTKLVLVHHWHLIFIVDRSTKRIGLFALMHRDDDYSDELCAAIEKEFDELGFTKY